MRAHDHYRYANEAAIHWVKPEDRNLPYLRESTKTVSTRHQKRRMPDRVVAYSVLRPDADGLLGPWRTRTWSIRYWWLASHDPYQSCGGPIEAVDPHSIEAGKPTRTMTTAQWERQDGYQRFVRPSLVGDPMPRMWGGDEETAAVQ